MIHTVGPVWHGGNKNERALLASAYRNSMQQAKNIGARSLAFPAISTGVYRFPKDEAARIAVGTVVEFARHNPVFDEIVFACFSEDSAQEHRRAFDELS